MCSYQALTRYILWVSGKKKRHGVLPPIEDGRGDGGAPQPSQNGVFVFRGQEGAGHKSPPLSNVRDDGFHTCGFEMEDGAKCQFR